MSIVIGFIYKYFFDALLVVAVGAVTKVLINYFGNDRTDKIKEAILIAMLWAEENFGIGNGSQKWTEAWKKLIEILQKQGIKLKKKEISLATTIMKANIPEINSLTYSRLPEEAKEIRTISRRSPGTTALVEELRKKHAVGKKDK